MTMTTMPAIIFWFLILASLVVFNSSTSSSSSLLSTQNSPQQQVFNDHKKRKVILVVGSANVDTFLPVVRLPSEGENLTTQRPPMVDLPGGKGCTQAVAASKLVGGDNNNVDNNDEWIVRFVGQFGLQQDGGTAAHVLKETLRQHNIDYTFCGFHQDLPCGRGYVFLTETGSVSAVVSGGSNQYGWQRWKDVWENNIENSSCMNGNLEEELNAILEGVHCVMLQREVPEYVNLLIAKHAKSYDPSIVICQDVGGEDRPISREMLKLCDYLVPNESELKRLVQSSCKITHLPSTSTHNDKDHDNDENFDVDKYDDSIHQYVLALQQMGATNVLVTRGSHGSVLFTPDGGVIQQPAIRLPPSENVVVDETGAGDCYRAAFCVALMEGHQHAQCMLFASAAGSCSVQVHGAVPSTPTRSRVLDRMSAEMVLDIPRGDGQSQRQNRQLQQLPTMLHNPVEKTVLHDPQQDDSSTIPRGGGNRDNHDQDFPFLFGSRLNSMKDRPDLWEGKQLESPRDYIERQANVGGLTCVDFNYPQHFGSYWTSHQAKAALEEVGLVAGAVCLRYPSVFARGAMNHPHQMMRRKAIELTKEAAKVAMDLGTNEVVIWSAYDGYDYCFQVDYDEKWDQLIAAFRELCDEFPSIRFSLEYKPTDENTRFFTVPTTGAALLFVEEVDRPNMGLTLDVGHMLMAGENPGQSIAMVGRKQKLFGIQLNDGYTRLAAEDGLMFASIHPSMALEIMYQLRRTNFRGHFYFDTFPQRSNPIQEAEYNIRQAKRFWTAACAIDPSDLKLITDEHDAIAAMELVNRVMWNKKE
jgi:sugar/nucleoside kinase (ribokinase family)/sugar phosphate isomerase/epimerase